MSAEDITAARRAATTSGEKMPGNIWRTMWGKACSAVIPGNMTLAIIPIQVIPKAANTRIPEAIRADLRATFPSFELRKREKISGPTR